MNYWNNPHYKSALKRISKNYWSKDKATFQQNGNTDKWSKIYELMKKKTSTSKIQ